MRFSIKNEKLCIQNEELCVQNADFVRFARLHPDNWTAGGGQKEWGARRRWRPTRGIRILIESYEFCIKNEQFCIKNEELRIKNEEFCIKHGGFCR